MPFRGRPLEHREILAIVTVILSWGWSVLAALGWWPLVWLGITATLFLAPFAWFALGCHVSFRFGAGVFGITAAGVAAAEAAYILSTRAWERGTEAEDSIGISTTIALGWFVFFLLGQGARLISRRFGKVPASGR